MTNLRATVTNILNRIVTEEEAMIFARDNFAELALYIRDRVVEKMLADQVKGKAIYIGYEKTRQKRLENKKL